MPLGSTRLDRLLSLLEGTSSVKDGFVHLSHPVFVLSKRTTIVGSTTTARKMAAQQIGEIQKYHPYDLQNLMGRICREYLKSASWETRTAAGFAIEAIVANVPLWDPPVAPALGI